MCTLLGKDGETKIKTNRVLFLSTVNGLMILIDKVLV